MTDEVLKNNKEYCSGTNKLSEWTTNSQIILYCLFGIGVTIYCFMTESKWKNKKSFKSKFISFFQIVWKKKLLFSINFTYY